MKYVRMFQLLNLTSFIILKLQKYSLYLDNCIKLLDKINIAIYIAIAKQISYKNRKRYL